MLEVVRTAKLEFGPALGRDAFLEFLDQTGFPDAGLAAQQHDLAGSVFGLTPTVEQCRQGLLATHQGRQAAPDRSPKAVPLPTLTQDLIHRHRLGQAAQRALAERPPLTQSLNQAGRRPADDDRIGPGQVLQARRNIRGLAQRQPLKPPGAAHFPDHHLTGMNADSHPQRPSGLPEQGRSLDRPDDAQAGPHSLDRVVLMGDRVPEIDQQPVAQVLGDMAGKAGHHLRTQLLVAADDIAQFFGVQLLGQAGGPHHIAEQDGQLTPLGRRASHPGHRRQAGAALITKPGRRAIVGSALGAAHSILFLRTITTV